MAISFNVRLGPTEWAPHLNGWECPVLRIPGIAVTSLEDKGVALDSHWYEVRPDNAYIKWNRSNPIPQQITAFFELKEILVTKQSSDDLTRFWKTFAIFVPVLTALIAAIGSYLVATHNGTSLQATAVVPKAEPGITLPNATSNKVEPSPRSDAKPEPPSSFPSKSDTKVASHAPPSFSHEAEIANLAKNLSSGGTYSWPEYNNNLQSLESILSAFVGDLQAGQQIDKAQEAMFFQALEGAVDLSRGRACRDLPNDGFADVHCSKNFNDYDNIVVFLKQALAKGAGQDLPGQLMKVQAELTKWLGQSHVKA